MKEYLGILVGVALLQGIVLMVAPHGEERRTVRLLSGLCLLCALVRPLSGILTREWDPEGWLISREPSPPNYEEIYKESLRQGSKSQAEELIKQKILQEFSLLSEQIDIEAKIVTQKEGLSLEEVTLLLRESTLNTDPRALADFVRHSYQCSYVVVYDIYNEK